MKKEEKMNKIKSEWKKNQGSKRGEKGNIGRETGRREIMNKKENLISPLAH